VSTVYNVDDDIVDLAKTLALKLGVSIETTIAIAIVMMATKMKLPEVSE